MFVQSTRRLSGAMFRRGPGEVLITPDRCAVSQPMGSQPAAAGGQHEEGSDDAALDGARPEPAPDV